MSYTAKVFRILIASPSDVEEEREQISKVIQEWNDLHSHERKIVLLPLKWETHSSPEYNKRPQDVINKEVVDYCDMAVGVFWTRLGSPTGSHESGTIEEIERVGKSGKIVMLYFSKAKVELDDIDLEQYKKLKDFKKKTFPNSLIEHYKNIVDFRDKFAKQLEIKLRSLILENNESTLDDFNNDAKLEIGIIDPMLNDIIPENSKIVFDTLKPENKDQIPDYEKQGEDDYKDKDYYRDIVSNLRERSLKKEFKVYLKNIGPIGIRDIYIEFRLKKNECAELTAKSESMFTRRNKLWLSTSRLLREETNFEDFEDHFLMKLQFDALQPKRTVKLDEELILLVQKEGELEFEATIYADCFSKPLITTLKYKVGIKQKSFDAIQYLRDFEEI